MNQKKHFKDKKMKKTLFTVLAFLTLLTGCFKSENTNTVSTDGSTSREKVIGILPDILNTIYVILLILTFIINTVAEIIGKKLKKRK
jgi:hypothetical protein